jgi:hypothetical protein
MSGHFRGSWSAVSNTHNHPSDIDQPNHPTGMTRYDQVCGVHPADRQLVDGYTRMVADRANDGWSCHLLTFLFSRLPGPRGAVIQAMRDEVHRVYSTLVTRTHREPRTASPEELPVLVATVDLPVYKRDRSSSPVVLCNGGLHFHAVLLVPPGTRLDRPVDEHILAYRDMYLGKRGLIANLDVRPVNEGHELVVDYVFKTILRRRVSYDDGVLVLPRTRGELPDPVLGSAR